MMSLTILILAVQKISVFWSKLNPGIILNMENLLLCTGNGGPYQRKAKTKKGQKAGNLAFSVQYTYVKE